MTLGEAVRHDEPASSAQQRFWLLHELAEDPGALAISVAFRLEGPLKPERLAAALSALVDRHEALRTSLVHDRGRLRQVVHADVSLTLGEVDLRDLGTAEQRVRVRALLAENAVTQFSLREPPLLAARLARLGDTSWILLLAIHHVAADEWSVQVLLRELSVLYAGGTKLATPRRQYREVARREQAWLDSADARAEADHWRRTLRDVPVVTPLPGGVQRPGSRAYVVGEVTTGLKHALSRQTDEFSASIGGTRFMVLLAALARLLQRTTGNAEVVVGTPSGDRREPEDEDAVGPMINTLALRLDASPTATFRDLALQARAVTLQALAHGRLPFERVVAQLGPARNSSYAPLCQIMLITQRPLGQHLALPGVACTMLDAPAQRTSELDLTFVADASPGGQAATMEYALDLYSEAQATEIAEEFMDTLACGLREPDGATSPRAPVIDGRVADVALERAPAGGWGLGRCAHHLVLDAITAHPDALAVSSPDERLTYAELDRRSALVARALRARGVGPDVRVGLALEGGVDAMVALLAILRAGGAYVCLDPAYPLDRLRFMHDDSQPVCVIGPDPAERVAIAADWATVPELLFSEAGGEADDDSAGPQHLAYVIYTSGSTGIPKGVAMTHQPLVNMLETQRAATAGRRTLQLSSLSFGLSFQEIFTAWSWGGSLVVPGPGVRRDMDAVVRTLVDQAVECVYLGPVALQEIARICIEDDILPEALHEAYVAGEPLVLTPHIRALFARLPNATLINQYGASETHLTLQHRLTGEPRTWPHTPPIGRPVAGVEVGLLESDAGGELIVGGPCLSRGYLGRTDKNRESFVAHPGAERGLVYRSGDLARRSPEGLFEFIGRGDDQIQLRGYRIELGEVEAVLRQHHSIREAGVVAARRDGRPNHLVAVVTGVPQASVAGIRGWLAERLPEWMLPSRVIGVEEMPLTPSGKLDRRSLEAEASRTASGGAEAPHTEVEAWIARAWQEVLGIGPPGIRDDFAAVGGDSLGAARLASRLRRRSSGDVTVADVFRHRTIEQQAELISRGAAVGSGAPQTEPRGALTKQKAARELAINGGRPVRTRPWPTYDKGDVFVHTDDEEAGLRALRSHLYFRYDVRPFEETEVARFEQNVCDYFGCRNALAVSTGTAAIAVALMALGLPRGSLVACPGFTFAATPSAILLAGCRPVLIEADHDLHIDVADLRRKYTPEMRAIVVVHMRGFASDVEELRRFADEIGVPVVEDAVPALGVDLDGRRLGTFGRAGAFSTQSDKSINTGEGGFVITDDDELFARAVVLSGAYEGRLRRHLAGTEPPISDLDLPLFNFRMDEIRGALAASQMRRLPLRVELLRANYTYLAKALGDLPGLTLRQPVASGALLGDALLFRVGGAERDEASWFAEALRGEGIDARALGCERDVNVRCFWNWSFAFPGESASTVQSRLPRTTALLKQTVDVPLAPSLTRDDCDQLIDAITKVAAARGARASALP
jgi:amino acid adenylation domain-containing protein